MKKCKWCQSETKTFYSHDPDGEGVQVSVDETNRVLRIYSNEVCSNIELAMPIKGCPMCLRRFKSAKERRKGGAGCVN